MTLPPFDRVVHEHGPTVLRLCRAMVGPDDADDVWSETFLSAMGAYPDLRPDSNLAAWLTTIAHRRSIDQLRRRARTRHNSSDDVADRLVDAPGDMSGDVVDPDLSDTLDAALRSLTPNQRAAVTAHHVVGLSYAEIATMLGISEPAARRRAADGIANLRAALDRGVTS